MSKFTQFLKFTSSYVKKSNNTSYVVLANLLDFIASILKLILPIIVVNKIFPEISDDSSEREVIEVDTTIVTVGAIGLLLANIIPTLREYILASVRADFQEELSVDMLSVTYDMKLDEHLSAPTGEFAQLLRHVYISVEDSIPNLNGGIIPSSLDLAMSMVGLFITDFYIALIQLGIHSVYIGSAFYNSYKIDEYSKLKLKKVYAAYGGLLSAIDRYQVAHHFDNVEFELTEARKILIEQGTAFKNENRQKAVNTLRSYLIAMFGFSGILLYEFGNLDKPKNLALLSLFLFNSALSLIKLGDSIEKIYVITNECQDIIKFLNNDKNRALDGKLELIIDGPPSIEFKDVNFSYQTAEGKQAIAITNFNYTINPGEKIAIVGESGAGKSTILKLLLRFYEADSGKILINNIDIKDVTKKSLRMAMSVVSNNPHLFNGTIAENIQYGDTNAPRVDIQEAADLAGLEEWKNDASSIRTLDENIGAAGDKLSSGQKQRVALARALMKSSHLFLFDEATSALDIATEKTILDRINLLTRHETTLIITHRLTTIINADKIIYMEQGKIADQGTFAELMAKKNLFYKQLQVECIKLGVSVDHIHPSKINPAKAIGEEKIDPVAAELSRKIGLFCHNRRNDRSKNSKIQPKSEPSGSPSTTRNHWFKKRTKDESKKPLLSEFKEGSNTLSEQIVSVPRPLQQI